MTATKISDLLPIPEGARKPHAYQVFGLEGGEQDADKIKAAVAEVYQRLNETKSGTDPKLWNKAAAVVEKARGILSDPRKRASLDERFGVIRFDDEPNSTAPGQSPADPLAGVLPATDPLAGVLPSSDPLGAVIPGGNPMAVATAPMTPGTAPMGVAPTAPVATQQPAQPQPGAHQNQQPAPLPPAPAANPVVAGKKKSVFVPKKSSRRRRKSSLGVVMFATFMVAMFAIIGSTLYFMYSGGQLSVTQKDGKVSVSTSPPEQAKPVRNRGRIATGPPVPLDPVLGSVPSGPNRPTGSLAGAVPSENPGQMSPTGMTPPTETIVTPEPEPVPTPPSPEPVTPDPDPMPEPMETEPTETPDPAKPNSETLPVKPAEEGPPTEMSDEMIAKADAAIKNVESLIQNADWDKMKPAADKVTEMTLTDEQREYADALYNLADLATFYRGGIVKGMSSLKTASTFEITDGVEVLVVEATEIEITIRRSARNRTYTLDDMPFVLADRLAAFVLPADKPDSTAARSCYQCIAPKSTPEYRKDALSWLQFVNDDLDDVDTKKVAEAVKKLFPDS